MMKSTIVFIFLILSLQLSAQSTFKGQLLCRQDSTPVPFAMVKVMGADRYAQSDEQGLFRFKSPEGGKTITMVVFAIGLRDTVTVPNKGTLLYKIYVDMVPLGLSAVAIQGLTAESVVREAVEHIPQNYSDSSFAAFSFFRQYEKANGVYRGLAEVQAVVLFQMAREKAWVIPSYGFNIEQMRRSDYYYLIDDFTYLDYDFSDLLTQDPIYQLTNGSLNPNALRYYHFRYDSTERDDVYIIHYVSPDFSSELHGVENLRDLDWKSESWEEGVLTIDRKTLAFIRVERTAFRNPDFHYPRNNNYLMPSKRYYCEFVDAKMVAEYQQIRGKWFPSYLSHVYTNEYYNAGSTKRDLILTEVMECFTDSISHFISNDLAEKFFKDSPLPLIDYVYDASKWTGELPPYRNDMKEAVYRDIEMQRAIELQFQRYK